VHENIGDIMSPKGRLIVEQKLTHHKLTVKLADMSANEILDEYLAKYGLSNEDLKENADRMWNYLNRSSSSDEYLEH
jgi:DNA polymerase III delta prime subunit